MNVLRIFKNYEFGNERTGGYYKIKIHQNIISDSELEQYELYSPIFKDRIVILGVKPFYSNISINDVASTLLNQLVFGDCILTCEDIKNIKNFVMM